MQIRAIKDEEIMDAFALTAQAFAFGDRDSSWLEHPNRLPRAAYGVWDENGLQAKVVVMSYRMHLGPEVVVPMGGIADVSCLPASRGRGYASACMKYALERMREAGQVVSTLFPFSWDYYRRLGYEWVGVQRRYTVEARALEVVPETEKVRAARPTDRYALIAAYTRFAGQYRGMIARDPKLWADILDDTDTRFAYTYLYERNGQVEGYLTYRGGKQEETRLREFICLTPTAQRALLGLLHRLEMQTDKFVWRAPNNDTLWQQGFRDGIETEIQPKTQGRIVDVAGALQAWRPTTEGRGAVNLAVRDESAPWNTGTWRVEFADREVSVQRTESAPQVSLDIQALSQAYFGEPSLDEVRAADRLQAHDEAGYATLRQLLDGPPMWMNDSF